MPSKNTAPKPLNLDETLKMQTLSRLISNLIFYWKGQGKLHRLWTACEYGELVSFCDVMLSKNRNDHMVFFYRGLANEMLHHFDQAIDDFENAESALLANKRKNFAREYFTKIPINLSRVYRKLQDNGRAMQFADKAVQANETATDGLTWRASLKEDNGDNVGAINDLNEALRRKPMNKTLTQMRDRLTYIIITQKRFEDA